MLIGAPGVYNWTGTIIRIGGFSSTFIDAAENRPSQSQSISGFGEKLILNVTRLPQFLPNGYLGD